MALIGSCSLAMAADATIAPGLTYVYNGERLHIDNCNIRDLSDTSNCLVSHPDKMQNGRPIFTYESRGTLKKLLPTCQQPSAQAAAKMQTAQQKNVNNYETLVNAPKPVAPANPPQG